jgi:hypothetical protein
MSCFFTNFLNFEPFSKKPLNLLFYKRFYFICKWFIICWIGIEKYKFSTYESRISLSDETIEINMNDAIMEEQYEENP